MGQYHKVVNLDKFETFHPRKFNSGLKLYEQAHSGTVGICLVTLLASHSNGAGGGDLDPSPVVGSWRGDRIAYVGDYDDHSSYKTTHGELSGASIYKHGELKDISEELVKYFKYQDK